MAVSAGGHAFVLQIQGGQLSHSYQLGKSLLQHNGCPSTRCPLLTILLAGIFCPNLALQLRSGRAHTYPVRPYFMAALLLFCLLLSLQLRAGLVSLS